MSSGHASEPAEGALLVVGAHARDFVRRDGLGLDEIKALRRAEASSAAAPGAASRTTLQARMLARATGHDAPGEPLGAPPVFFLAPHQPEQCDFKPDVLLDITPVLARRRGVQLRRNAGPHPGLAHTTVAEAYV
jgi:hypothetical protein